MVRYCFFTIAAFWFFTACAYAQVVKGKVLDAVSGSPIANASIYLNGSSSGTTSNAQGEFTFNTAETRIPLVVSCVGYQSQSLNNYNTNNLLTVSLNRRTMALGEVVIGSTSREEQLKIFMTEFIGSTSKDCIISNTENINFHYSKKTKTLEADASEPLIIYNKKLGYKITYFLSLFKHSPKDGVHYEGNYFFEEDTLGLNPGAVKRIKKNRDRVYFGSRMHFIRSLWADDLAYNDFSIYDEKSRQRNINAMLTERFFDPKVHAREFYKYLVKNYSSEKYIEPLNSVTINYTDNYGYYVSYLKLEETTARTNIEANGYYGPNVVWSGVMGGQRVNVLLPYEFQPFEPIAKQRKPDPQVITDPALARLVIKQNNFFKLQIPEKVYLQTDKPYYMIGDTLRLKAYLLNADYLTPTDRSGMLYVELDDPEGKPAKRIMLPVNQGLAWGDIALDEKDVPHGSYTLRAYTNWMRNFGEDYIYKQDIYVSPITGNETLVKANFKQDGSKVETALQFTALDGKLMVLKDMELKVMAGRKNISKNQINTGMDGIIKMNFEIPQPTKANPLSPIILQAKEVTKGTNNATTINIPVILNRLENMDIQFMPEGGNLVAGIKTKVGIKAIGEDGKGANITGKIINNKQQEVTEFKTTHAGMGSIEFTPKTGEVYLAKVDGINKTYQLPMVNAIGTTLKIQPAANNDSLSVIITASAELAAGFETYYLIGRARGVVCYAQVVRFNNGQVIKKSVPKELFPTGIARFTLHNATNLPVNERQVFIDQNDALQFTITNQMETYGVRDSIALTIEVKDKYNRPVQGSFSMAITDDNQVKIDSLRSNMRNNLLLTSDLKGNIEEPGYYFTAISKQKQAELDNLMLTQGWVGYNWEAIFKPAVTLAYQPEKEFTVKGKATNAFGKAIAKSKVVLLLNKSLAVRDTLTDSLGRFVFTGLVPLDSAVINLQARNKRGKEFNIGLDVDEFKSPEFKKATLQVPWYLNTDTTLLKNSQAKANQAKAVADYNGEGRMLGEVLIKDKRVVKDSKNLNGPGEADEILDEDFMHKSVHQTLAQLLEDKYKTLFQKEFRVGGSIYRLKNHVINLIIDGVFIAKLGLPVQDYMDYLDAEDIKGIEIMNSVKYAVAYNPEYASALARLPDRFVPIYLEVTTYSGNGAFYKKTPGIYLYRPIPYTLPKQFYAPKYTVANKTVAMGTDMRSTLHWEPNIITNAEGKATVSFFTADKPAGYTLIIEGFTGQGEVGYSRQKIKSTTAK